MKTSKKDSDKTGLDVGIYNHNFADCDYKYCPMCKDHLMEWDIDLQCWICKKCGREE
jgi:ribosomal protein L37AE/L43A